MSTSPTERCVTAVTNAELSADLRTPGWIRQRPLAQPCATCPWRKENWDKLVTIRGFEPCSSSEPCLSCHFRKEGGIVSTPAWRDELWAAQESWAAEGAGMVCHQYFGGQPGTRRAHHCAGALVLAQREVLRYHETLAIASDPSVAQALANVVPGKSAMPVQAIATVAHTMLRDRNLQVHGDAVWVVDRGWDGCRFAPFSDIPRRELLEAAHPSLADPEIAHLELKPARPGEFVDG
jgi:hypothetical protein